MLQQAVVVLLVVAAFAYSAWALMPAAWRLWLRRRLGLAAPAATGGCGGCGTGCATPAETRSAVITVHRRPR